LEGNKKKGPHLRENGLKKESRKVARAQQLLIERRILPREKGVRLHPTTGQYRKENREAQTDFGKENRQELAGDCKI